MLKKKLSELPIGVFDSGVGGLTVLKSLAQKLPQESFLYIGDTARVPYGTKSPKTVVNYTLQLCDILVQRGIKMLVIACNTASALALTALRENFPKLPIIEVIGPGAQAACQVTKNNIIAVAATEATIKAGGYQQAIARLKPEVQVIGKGCGLFVPLVEEGWAEDEIAKIIAKKYLDPLLEDQENKPDCLVLGCTHFPVMFNAIREVVHPDITIVDSATVTTELVAKQLQEQDLLNNGIVSQSRLRFLVTDSPERFCRISQQVMQMHVLPEDIELVVL